MIYTFLYGIDSIFRISESFLLETILYFLSFIVSIIGWKFINKNKSLLTSCLGFIFVPVFPLFMTLLDFLSCMNELHIKYFIIFGAIYIFILAGSLIFIGITTKRSGKKNIKQIFFIILSGIMFFFNNYIEVIFVFENIGSFAVLSVFPIVYYYLRVIIVWINNADAEKSKTLYSISNVIFWSYMCIYDLLNFALAAGSV